MSKTHGFILGYLFLLLSCLSSLYILLIDSLSDILVCRYFLLFILSVCFALQIFRLVQSQLPIFAFAACVFQCHSLKKKKNHCPGKCQEAFSLYFFFCVMVSGLIFKTIYELNFYIVGDKNKISFFGRWLCSFPNTSYWRDYSFPIFRSWRLVQEQLTVDVCCYFWALYPGPLVSVFMPVPY